MMKVCVKSLYLQHVPLVYVLFLNLNQTIQNVDKKFLQKYLKDAFDILIKNFFSKLKTKSLQILVNNLHYIKQIHPAILNELDLVTQFFLIHYQINSYNIKVKQQLHIENTEDSGKTEFFQVYEKSFYLQSKINNFVVSLISH